MVTSDEKSGYDHVKLQEQSQTYFGVQFGGWILTYTSLPFGFKASPYTAAFTYYYDPVFMQNKLTPLSIFRDLALKKRDSKKLMFYFCLF